MTVGRWVGPNGKARRVSFRRSKRERLFDAFRARVERLLVLSRVGDSSIDLPHANVLIRVSGLFGSRQGVPAASGGAAVELPAPDAASGAGDGGTIGAPAEGEAGAGARLLRFDPGRARRP